VRLTFLIVRMHTQASRYRMRMVEIATNSLGYRVNAIEVLSVTLLIRIRPQLHDIIYQILTLTWTSHTQMVR
jgi:hypothetical protein